MGQDTCSEPSGDLTSGVIYEEFRERIYRHILHLVRNPGEAEDLTQETFLRVHRNLASLQKRSTPGVWLYRIATNLCYDRFRQSSRRQAAVPLENVPEPTDRDAGPDDTQVLGLDQVVEQAEMSACVQEYLDKLPDDYRTAILLHDLQGLTNPEISEMLGCSLATVKIRLHRARQRLRDALADGCDFSYDERGVLVCDRKRKSC